MEHASPESMGRFPFSFVAVVSVFAVAVFGCASKLAQRPAPGSSKGQIIMPAPLILSDADHDTSHAVAVGQEVVLRLEENPTTGYRWSLRSEPDAAMELLDAPYTPGGAAPGAAGRREFHLRVRTPGTLQLHLKLWREWAGEGSTVERRTFVLQATT